MKKLLFIAIAVLGLTAVNAQEETKTGGFEKGDVFISGTVGFTTTSAGDISSDTFVIAPSAGYFVNENFAVGLSATYSEASVAFDLAEDNAEVDAKTFGGGVFGRYYFTPANQFSFFGNLGVAYASTDFVGTDLNTFSVGLAPGINYFLSDCIAIEASVGVLGYSSAKFDVDGAEAVNTFSLSLTSNVAFGVTYKF